MFLNTVMLAVGYGTLVSSLFWLGRPVRTVHPY
jgi:hypothetical protein